MEEGELEIGQIASLFREEQTAEAVINEIIRDFEKGIKEMETYKF